MKGPEYRPCRQHGVALITALLITALVTVIAVAMSTSRQLEIRRSGNMLEADQAYLYALAGESWARQMLAEDAEISGTDTLQEDWAVQVPPLPVENGSVSGSIEDMQGRFNLGNLIDAQGKADQIQVRAFRALLELLSNSDENISPSLANRVVDWIDSDLDTSIDGAEDQDYLALDVPYRTANQRMASVSELAAINGIEPSAFNTLLPFVVSLPGPTAVNINTASSAVLAGLHEDIDIQLAEELVSLRDNTPFESEQEFIEMLKSDYNIEMESGMVGVGSRYFMVTVKSVIGRTELRLYSLLQRNGNKVITLSRSLGTY